MNFSAHFVWTLASDLYSCHRPFYLESSVIFIWSKSSILVKHWRPFYFDDGVYFTCTLESNVFKRRRPKIISHWCLIYLHAVVHKCWTRISKKNVNTISQSDLKVTVHQMDAIFHFIWKTAVSLGRSSIFHIQIRRPGDPGFHLTFNRCR